MLGMREQRAGFVDRGMLDANALELTAWQKSGPMRPSVLQELCGQVEG